MTPERVSPQRSLILVKHAAPQIEPDQPAARWHLSAAGRAACAPLAAALARYAPSNVVASQEPKATETGRLVADHLRLPFETAPDLHEHDRTNVPFIGPEEDWHALIRRFFAAPAELVLGLETAHAARDRFAEAVSAVLDRHPTGNLVIVTHGTVIALFVAMCNPIEPYILWERLALPSFVVLDRDGFALREVIDRLPG